MPPVQCVLVGESAVIALRVPETFKRRQADSVFGGTVKGAISALLDGCIGRREECFGALFSRCRDERGSLVAALFEARSMFNCAVKNHIEIENA